MAMHIAAPAITRIARRLSEIRAPIYFTFLLWGQRKKGDQTPAPIRYSTPKIKEDDEFSVKHCRECVAFLRRFGESRCELLRTPLRRSSQNYPSTHEGE